MALLTVAFIDEVHHLSPDDSLSFGRDADLVIDTNRFLHRRLGAFRHIDGTWWLSNLGSSLPLDIIDTNSPSRLSLAPGASTPLPFVECRITFAAGQSSYELELEIEADEPALSDDPGTDETGTVTVTASTATLNPEQRLLLVTLAERRLREGIAIELPTNREAAAKLGWTSTKFNRKLDNLCIKFDRLGVQGLKGDLGGLANARRERLIDYVVTVGIISPADLDLLEAHA